VAKFFVVLLFLHYDSSSATHVPGRFNMESDEGDDSEVEAKDDWLRTIWTRFSKTLVDGSIYSCCDTILLLVVINNVTITFPVLLMLQLCDCDRS